MRPLGFRASALSVSLLGHLLLVSALLTITPLGRRATPSVPGLPIMGAGYSTDRATLLFIEEEGSAVDIDRPAPLSLELRGELRLQIPPLLPAVPEMSDIDDADGTANSAEPAPIAGTDSVALLQRYIGQIQARIERARDLPPHATSDYCRIEVSQAAGGEVLDLAVGECALDAAERQALIAAIRRASPLPAPPDARLFLPQLTLEFGTTRQL